MPSLSVSIPSPCMQKWQSMTPTQQGAYCASCKTEVIDFTTWSDERVIAYLKRKRTGCGKFRADQLKVFSWDEPAPRRRRWLWPAVISLMILLAKPASAQNSREMNTEKVVKDSVRTQVPERLKPLTDRPLKPSIAKPRIAEPPNIEQLLQGTLGGFVARPVPVVKPSISHYFRIEDYLRNLF